MASTNIFSQYLQAPRSVLDYQAQYEEGDARKANLQARTQQNALQALALRQQTDQFGQAQTERNALQRIAAGWSAATPVDQRIASLRNSGMPGLMSQADALEKSYTDRRDKDSQIAERDAKAGKDKQSLADQRKQSAITQVAALNSPQEAMQLLQSYTDSGEVPAQLAPALSRMIQTDPKWQLKLVMGISDPAKMLELLKPHLQTVNAGNAQVQQAVDPMTGKVTETGRTQIMQSPDSVASNITSEANNRRSVGASYANANATREIAQATKLAANAQRDQATEMKLADDYRAQSKDFKESASAHKQLTATLDSATKSPVATLAAATKFMKILDPGSVVRETELGMALAASGVIDRAMNYVNILQRGQVLTTKQAADFKDISNKMYGAAQQVQQTIDNDYKSKAKAYGLRPEMVTQDLGQNAPKVVNFGDLK